MAVLPIPTIPLPVAEILEQAQGSTPEALRLAACLGYQAACRDHDQVADLLQRKEDA